MSNRRSATPCVAFANVPSIEPLSRLAVSWFQRSQPIERSIAPMIIVTGMHRSGTSAAAHLLAEMGMDIGPRSQLLAGDSWNAKGYWENRRVLVCNDRLVLGGGALYPDGYYETPRDKRPAAMRWRMAMLWARSILHDDPSAIRRRARKLRPHMRLITDAFDGVLVKDPRFSLTLTMWQEHGAVERVLIALRGRESCAASLARRNRLPRRWGRGLWQRYYSRLMQALSGVEVVAVNFHRLLDPAKADGEIDRLAAFAGRPIDPGTRDRLRRRIVDPALATQPVGDELAEATDSLSARLMRFHETYDLPRPFVAE